MQDRPTDRELLKAVEQFIIEEIAPVVTDNPRLKCHLLIAVNVLNIVARELAKSEPLLWAEQQRLVKLLGQPHSEPPGSLQQLGMAIEKMSGELSKRIRTGEADTGTWRTEISTHLRQP